MQRLVTIYLDNSAYMQGKWITAAMPDKHGLVEEHLAGELSSGWRVISLTSFGGSGDHLTAHGWVTVLLEKD
jgi:hypothetical protein